MTRSTPDWHALDGVIDGDVALPGASAYNGNRPAFNARFDDLRPQAIVRCASPHDVAETISFVARHHLEHVTRSGGHSFAGHSSSRGVVIDVTPMSSVTVTGGEVSVGAGTRLGDLYAALQPHGLTIPGGTCPSVGIAGLALGGGLGILGRTYGVTSDRLLRAQLVLADGRVVECDQDHDADLFWALRGAGAGNFGVVTSLVFRPVGAPEVTNFHVAWTFPHAAAAIGAWQRWAPDAPDELAASLKVTVSGGADEPPSVDVYGALIGGEADAAGLLEQLVDQTASDPSLRFRRRMSYPATREFWAHLGEADGGPPAARPEPQTPRELVYMKSEFFSRPMPAEAIAALVANFSLDRRTGESRELDFMPWGGAYNRVPPDATAFVHRHELFQLKHSAVVAPETSRPDAEGARRWVTRSWAAVHPWASGRVFQNFADPDLDGWADAYYGTNYERLASVKARYDPANFFRFPQSLPAGRSKAR
jgi:FAD/FMN-containing dehydrogenase